MLPILLSTPIGPTSISRAMASSDPEGVIRAWTAAYTEEVADFAPPDQVNTLIHEVELGPMKCHLMLQTAAYLGEWH